MLLVDFTEWVAKVQARDFALKICNVYCHLLVFDYTQLFFLSFFRKIKTICKVYGVCEEV
jgi:hypothetical protein